MQRENLNVVCFHYFNNFLADVSLEDREVWLGHRRTRTVKSFRELEKNCDEGERTKVGFWSWLFSFLSLFFLYLFAFSVLLFLSLLFVFLLSVLSIFLVIAQLFVFYFVFLSRELLSKLACSLLRGPKARMTRILGGQEAKFHVYKWQASLSVLIIFKYKIVHPAPCPSSRHGICPKFYTAAFSG